tara:strand:+ start:5389 stop:5901 length:513 start_codon:yes stop_codon:yes gene_type:complete
MSNVDQTLQQCGNLYGEFSDRARISQNIKNAMQDSQNWSSLSNDKKESLEMIASKISRILNGDPECKDSWHDITGYTKLVENTLKDDETAPAINEVKHAPHTPREAELMNVMTSLKCSLHLAEMIVMSEITTPFNFFIRCEELKNAASELAPWPDLNIDQQIKFLGLDES